MAKDAKKAAEEVAQVDDRDDRIALLEMELADAKKAAEDAAILADQAKRDMLTAQAEVFAMVDAGAKRPAFDEPKMMRVRLRDPRIVGLVIRGTVMSGEFRNVDVTGCSAKQIDDMRADPMFEVEG
jgi:hypothetical protein